MLPVDEGRYGSERMGAIFTTSGRYRRWLLVECEVARAQAELGMIPPAAAEAIGRAADAGIDLADVARAEQRTRHELAAVVQVLSVAAGEHGRWVHYGLTSSDVIDTGMARQLSEAIALLREALAALVSVCGELAAGHAHLPVAGRTHGQYAEPVTLGGKFAVYHDALLRTEERLAQLMPRVLVGKIGGAVGSGDAFGAHADELERVTLARLGLGAASFNSQAVARDRVAELIGWAALSAAVIENIATEVRNLQRSGIGEVREPAGPAQVGSSAMPHKRNPVLSENICGLARLVRSLVQPALENVVSWHERDLCNSANERFVIPQACVLLEEMFTKMRTVLAGLEVDHGAITRNLEQAATAWSSGEVLRLLVRGGVARGEAHAAVQAGVRAGHVGERLADELLTVPAIAAAVGRAELVAAITTGPGSGQSGARAARLGTERD